MFGQRIDNQLNNILTTKSKPLTDAITRRITSSSPQERPVFDNMVQLKDNVFRMLGPQKWQGKPLNTDPLFNKLASIKLATGGQVPGSSFSPSTQGMPVTPGVNQTPPLNPQATAAPPQMPSNLRSRRAHMMAEKAKLMGLTPFKKPTPEDMNRRYTEALGRIPSEKEISHMKWYRSGGGRLCGTGMMGLEKQVRADGLDPNALRDMQGKLESYDKMQRQRKLYDNAHIGNYLPFSQGGNVHPDHKYFVGGLVNFFKNQNRDESAVGGALGQAAGNYFGGPIGGKIGEFLGKHAKKSPFSGLHLIDKIFGGSFANGGAVPGSGMNALTMADTSSNPEEQAEIRRYLNQQRARLAQNNPMTSPRRQRPQFCGEGDLSPRTIQQPRGVSFAPQRYAKGGRVQSESGHSQKMQHFMSCFK